jgi:hypothetical protein
MKVLVPEFISQNSSFSALDRNVAPSVTPSVTPSEEGDSEDVTPSEEGDPERSSMAKEIV